MACQHDVGAGSAGTWQKVQLQFSYRSSGVAQTSTKTDARASGVHRTSGARGFRPPLTCRVAFELQPVRISVVESCCISRLPNRNRRFGSSSKQLPQRGTDGRKKSSESPFLPRAGRLTCTEAVWPRCTFRHGPRSRGAKRACQRGPSRCRLHWPTEGCARRI